MNIHNSPEYLVSTLENEIEKLGVDKDFVKDVCVFHCSSKEDGICKPKIENGKMTGVIIVIKEGKSKKASKFKVFHEVKHAEQYFKRGPIDVLETNPVYNEIEAYLYGFKRLIEEDLKTAYRSLKRIFIPFYLSF